MVSRVCDEFHCLPDAAREAINNDYNGSIFRMIEMRGLADAKQRVDHADAKHPPTDPLAMRYLRIQMAEVGKELNIQTDA